MINSIEDPHVRGVLNLDVGLHLYHYNSRSKFIVCEDGKNLLEDNNIAMFQWLRFKSVTEIGWNLVSEYVLTNLVFNLWPGPSPHPHTRTINVLTKEMLVTKDIFDVLFLDNHCNARNEIMGFMIRQELASGDLATKFKCECGYKKHKWISGHADF